MIKILTYDKYYLGGLGPFIACYDQNGRWVQTVSKLQVGRMIDDVYYSDPSLATPKK